VAQTNDAAGAAAERPEREPARQQPDPQDEARVAALARERDAAVAQTQAVAAARDEALGEVAALAQSHQDALAQLAAQVQARVDLEAQLAALGVGPAPGGGEPPPTLEPVPLVEASAARPPMERHRERPARGRSSPRLMVGWIVLILAALLILALATGLLRIDLIP
jgi:hypothetical protein